MSDENVLQEGAPVTEKEVVVKPRPVKEKKPSLWFRFKRLMVEYRRVLRATKKPNLEELKQIVKISGMGIVIIGLIGFLIAMGKELIL